MIRSRWFCSMNSRGNPWRPAGRRGEAPAGAVSFAFFPSCAAPFATRRRYPLERHQSGNWPAGNSKLDYTTRRQPQGEIERREPYAPVEPVSVITNTAALGGIVATAIALGTGKEREASQIMRGTVAGAILGICRLIVEGLWF